MTRPSHDDGVILALIHRFETQRLPKLQALKAQTERGERLSDVDIAFLDTVIHDALQNKPLIDKHQEWQSFCANVIHLCETITKNGLENESNT